MPATATASGIQKRPFGNTGIELSVIGFGGIVVTDTPQDEANRVVAEAFERGINYFDVAPGYGTAEEILGPALEPYRKKAFLACKTAQRSRPGAEADLKTSFERLRTDYFDLYQLHGITSVENDVDPVFQKGGVMDMILEAKAAGKIRYVGFSAHSEEAAFAAMDRYDFDSVLFPFNFCTWHTGGFGPKVMERAQEKGVARLALKPMAKQMWAEGHPERSRFTKCWYEPLYGATEAELALRWTLSQPVTAAIPPGDAALFKNAMDFAERFTPVTEEETQQLETWAKSLNPLFRIEQA
jgi:aryl-alcohol dehydrogenase-like predicted oxidoreductase